MFYGRFKWFCLFFHACPTRTNQSSAVRLINCSRGIVAWLKVVHVSWVLYIVFGKRYNLQITLFKENNRLYDICVSLCMGPLKWIVSFQWVLYPWYWEEIRDRLGWSQAIFRQQNLFEITFHSKTFFRCRVFHCSKRFFENLYFFKNIFSFEKPQFVLMGLFWNCYGFAHVLEMCLVDFSAPTVFICEHIAAGSFDFVFRK